MLVDRELRGPHEPPDGGGIFDFWEAWVCWQPRAARRREVWVHVLGPAALVLPAKPRLSWSRVAILYSLRYIIHKRGVIWLVWAPSIRWWPGPHLWGV